MTMDRVRIGTLGAARITPNALTKPAKNVPDVEVTTVAARDMARAKEFADKQGIPRVLDSYKALIDDPEIDAIYNPLPNGLHGVWTIAALEAGKHVLCEKPFTANAQEAEQVKAVADRTGKVVMEAFHWRYHPLAARAVEIIQSGELGDLRHIHTQMVFPLPRFRDIRWSLPLAGGALMDAGCYTIHMLRTLAGAEPDVTRAVAKQRSPGVDQTVVADFAFPGGFTGRITTSMLSSKFLRMSARVVGTKGELKIFNPVAPQFMHRFTVKSNGSTRRERFPKIPTYQYQLQAFADAVLRGAPTLTPPTESIANMKVIDAVYRAAGMEPRQPTT
ncbi:MAG: Gfo/Idh/MocA family oxidoreductase [Actinobacteria bacterium]|nr:Gfo/Idh/MocA family oxidoreductase [Actinomycetota bacterium]